MRFLPSSCWWSCGQPFELFIDILKRPSTTERHVSLPASLSPCPLTECFRAARNGCWTCVVILRTPRRWSSNTRSTVRVQSSWSFGPWSTFVRLRLELFKISGHRNCVYIIYDSTSESVYVGQDCEDIFQQAHSGECRVPAKQHTFSSKKNYYSRHLNGCLSSYFIHTLLRRRHWIWKEYRLRIIAGGRRKRRSLWSFVAEEDYYGTSLHIIVGLRCRSS